MQIAEEIEKEGIHIIETLDTLTINAIAKTVASKLVKAFPNQDLDDAEIFIKLSRLNMYVAKLPSDLSSAKYYYKNRSIYFNENVDLSHIDSCVIHECIHAIQEDRDEKDNLIRLGFCNFLSSRLKGMALNEAAVQQMSSYAVNSSLDTVKYFDITLSTSSPSHYTLECALLNQMAYLTGNYPLFHSTLYSDDLFREKFISLTNKETYQTIEKNLDKMLDLEDALNKQTFYLTTIDENAKVLSNIAKKISKIRTKIQCLFLDTQNLILTRYFDKKFMAISTLVQIDDYRKKLYNFKDLIGYTDTYSFYNDYYIQKMSELELKRNEVENKELSTNSSLLLVPMKQNFLSTLIQKVTKLWSRNEVYEKIHN